MRWIRRIPSLRSAIGHLPRLVAVMATLVVASCGGAAVPTSPSGDTPVGEVLSVEMSCPVSLLVGQKGPCTAVARLRSGQTPVVNVEATWSSTRPDVVAVDPLGVVNGRSAGQAMVSASYGGRSATATVSVTSGGWAAHRHRSGRPGRLQARKYGDDVVAGLLLGGVCRDRPAESENYRSDAHRRYDSALDGGEGW